MIKRLTWFVTGLVAGAGSVMLVGRRVKKRVADLAPVRVAERALDRTKEAVARVRQAAGDGRVAMRQREDELRIKILGTHDESPSGSTAAPSGSSSPRSSSSHGR